MPYNLAIIASGYDLSGSGSVNNEQYLEGLGVTGIGGIPGVFIGAPTDLIEGTVDADRRGTELSFELGKPKRFGLHPAGAGPFGGKPVNYLGYNRRGPSTSVTTAYAGLRAGTFDQSLESQFIADTPAFGINSAWDAQYGTEYDAKYFGAYLGASFSRTYRGAGDLKTTFSLTGTLGVNFYDVDVQETVDANGLGGALNYSNAANYQFNDELIDATLRFGVDRQRGNFSSGLYLDCDFGGIPEINRELPDSDLSGALPPNYSLSARPSTEIGLYARWAF
ncbi:MAG: hypothetical protein QNJ35_02375 [Paracoccaceae bacterium]|nr:hypothetical protein [Paracoccaceae bacterium]